MGLVLIKMRMLIIVLETTAVRVAPIVSEVGAELENLYLGWNPGCSSAATHDDALFLFKRALTASC